MRYLLDTNALVWWLMDDPLLTKKARSVIGRPEHEIHASAATGWELATKVRIGKWETARVLLRDLPARLAREHISVLAVGLEAALLAGEFDHPHRDPFDRMIAAQAIVENMKVVSSDSVFDDLTKRRVW